MATAGTKRRASIAFLLPAPCRKTRSVSFVESLSVLVPAVAIITSCYTEALLPTSQVSRARGKIITSFREGSGRPFAK